MWYRPQSYFSHRDSATFCEDGYLPYTIDSYCWFWQRVIGCWAEQVLKNIDAFVGNRAMAGVSKELTFSGLLNVLDGALGANKGLIMVLTTNRFQRLQHDRQSADALLRPGRVSRLAAFREPTAAQLVAYFIRLFRPKPVATNGSTDDDGDGAVKRRGEPGWLVTAADAFVVGL